MRDRAAAAKGRRMPNSRRNEPFVSFQPALARPGKCRDFQQEANGQVPQM
jgi:hypothetical protein